MKKTNEYFLKSDDIDACYSPKEGTSIAIPFLDGRVSAGFPSSAENYFEKSLDLNELLIMHPAATFFVRVKGDSMINAGINSHDILIVDRAVAVGHNKIVIARIHEELTVKRLVIEGEKFFLKPENSDYTAIEVTAESDFEIWGIVTYIIHAV